MATGIRGLGELPPKSRLRNPLNVVVEKVGATRAMVHGDVSAESLKELLMSSLSLLPKTNVTNDQNDDGDGGSKESGVSDRKTGLEDLADGEGFGPSSMNKEQRGIPAGVSDSDNNEGEKIGGIEVGNIHDVRDSKKQLASQLKPGDKTKSGNRTEMNFRTELSGVNDHEEGEEGVGGLDEEEAVESLRSCLSVLSTEKSSLSHDGRWLRSHFGKSLVLGLRDVVKNKPLDPVCYLAFWLRKYRSDEEVKKRRIDFDNELQTERLLIRDLRTKPEESTGNSELEFHSQDEEGGGNADWNFRNYNLGSYRSVAAPEDTVGL